MSINNTTPTSEEEIETYQGNNKKNNIKQLEKIANIAMDEHLSFPEKAASMHNITQNLLKYYEAIKNKNKFDEEIISLTKKFNIYLNNIINNPPYTKYPPTIKSPILEFIQRVETMIKKDINEEYKKSLGLTTYYRKLISENPENIDAVMTINRLNFTKTHSELIPLGGKFKGQYLVRIITQRAFEAWKAAFEAGISCEELVKDKSGRYRLVIYPDGKIAVFTKYAGESLENYRFKDREEENSITEQIADIREKLQENNIYHRHLHEGNFCKLTENGKPKIRVIDFDLAVKCRNKISYKIHKFLDRNEFDE
ncbi:MAG: hypothetical protein ACP5N1_05530 [Candidatus Woesearchaeota archaeon]